MAKTDSPQYKNCPGRASPKKYMERGEKIEQAIATFKFKSFALDASNNKWQFTVDKC